MNRARKSKSI